MGEGSSMWINAGEMKNNGFEFNLGYRNDIGDFSTISPQTLAPTETK